MIQWLIAPDFALAEPKLVDPEEITTFYKLRGKPTLLSFARCTATGEEKAALDASLIKAAEVTSKAGVNHVTVYTGDCPGFAKGREPLRPAAVEKAYSLINRYPNVPYTPEIAQAHFLIDRSGFVRARYKQFGADDGNAAQFAAQAAILAQEPIVEISLHSH